MDERYQTRVQLLHWLIALMVIGLLIAGLVLKYDLAPKPYRPVLATLHMSFGLTVLLLMVLRIIMRLTSDVPKLPAAMSPAIRWASGTTQLLFYVLLIAMPIFGILFVEAHGRPISVFGLFDLPVVTGKSKSVKDLFYFLHFWGGITIIVLLVLHVGGAVRHQMRGERVLRRMMPRRSR